MDIKYWDKLFFSLVYPEFFLRISRVLIDPAHTRDIPEINPGYPKDNLPFEGQGLGNGD
jgi:hypothetical protein